MKTYTLTEEQIEQITSLADTFDDSDEGCYEAAAELVDELAVSIRKNASDEPDCIEDEICLANNDITDIFSDCDEHFYHGKFYDGKAVLEKEADDTNAPRKIGLVYPTMETVMNSSLDGEVRYYAGLGSDDEITYFHVALKYGIPYLV